MVTTFNHTHGDKFEYALQRVTDLYNECKYTKFVELSSKDISSANLQWGESIKISNIKESFVVKSKEGATVSEINSNLKQIILNEGETHRFTLIFAKGLYIRIILMIRP